MIYVKYEKYNPEVTKYYLETIAMGIGGSDYKFFTEFDQIITTRDDVIVVSYAPDALKVLRKKYKKLIFWVQGVWPEESFMKHSSALRFFVTSMIERIALNKADFIFYVSSAMKEHYRSKYHFVPKQYYIMPCLNEQIHKDSFFTDNKYDDNVFCYAGATVNWQCFEETVALYAKIEQEQQYKNCKLLLFVKNKELAMRYIEKYQVKNYEIDFVTVEELPEKLKEVKFGFLLRQESPVNAVATPTKMATYLSNGIIPIYSKALSGMEDMLKNTKYTIALSDFQDIEAIEPYLNRKIDPQEIYEDYNELFATVYNREQHIRTIRQVKEI